MDPSEALEELRHLVQEVYEYADDPEFLATSIADKVRELDEWITSGGELPEDWQND